MKGNRPFRGEQRLRASTATSVEAGLLSMEEGGEILRIERRTFLEDGRPVELTRSAYRGDRYTFVTEFRELRPGGGAREAPTPDMKNGCGDDRSS